MSALSAIEPAAAASPDAATDAAGADEESEWVLVQGAPLEDDVISADDDVVDDDAHNAETTAGDGAAGVPTASPTPVTYAGGRYERLGAVARGGQGTIHRCIDRRTGRTVAVKELRVAEGDKDARFAALRAQRELLVDGPHIMQVLDIFAEPLAGTAEEGADGDWALCTVMPYKPGGDLRAVIAGAKRHLQEEAVLSLALQLVKALKFLHAKGVFHMDVKPENILVDGGSEGEGGAEGGDGAAAGGGGGQMRVSLTDFDSARGRGRGVGEFDQTYAAPEVVRGAPRAVGPAADVFALGLVLFCLASLPQFPVLDNTMLSSDRWADPAALSTAITRHFNRCCYERSGVMVRYTSRLIELLRGMLSHEPKRRPTVNALEVAFSKLYEDLLTCIVVPELK